MAGYLKMAERETAHPRWLPTVNRDYDPILKQWLHPPPRWLWHYERKREQTKWDTIAGIVGVLILTAVVWGYVTWFY